MNAPYYPNAVNTRPASDHRILACCEDLKEKLHDLTKQFFKTIAQECPKTGNISIAITCSSGKIPLDQFKKVLGEVAGSHGLKFKIEPFGVQPGFFKAQANRIILRSEKSSALS